MKLCQVGLRKRRDGKDRHFHSGQLGVKTKAYIGGQLGVKTKASIMMQIHTH